MLHKWGREEAIIGTHDVSEFKMEDVVKFYVKIFNLYYGDQEGKEWLAKKIREDIPVLLKATKDSGITMDEVKYEWCNTHYKFLRKFLKEHYEAISVEYDADGHKIERYEVWIEQVEYNNPIDQFVGKP